MRTTIATASVLLASTTVLALSSAEQRGLTFAQANCALCHAVGPAGESPLPIAPPFRVLHESLDIDALAEPLHTGAISDHPSMPDFRLDAAQINDLIAYLHTLDSDT